MYDIPLPGFTAAEVIEIMGGPMPGKDQPEQRRAYARLAIKRLAEFDARRCDIAMLLLDAPDDLIDEWQAIARENAQALHAGVPAPQHGNTSRKDST